MEIEYGLNMEYGKRSYLQHVKLLCLYLNKLHQTGSNYWERRLIPFQTLKGAHAHQIYTNELHLGHAW